METDFQDDINNFTFGKKEPSSAFTYEKELAKHRRINNEQTFTIPTAQKISIQQSDIVGPARPQDIREENSSSDDSEDDQQNPGENLVQSFATKAPISHEVIIKGHSKSINALDIDNRGLRMISGSNDYSVRMWDFQGMNRSMNSFKILEPTESQPIVALSYNPEGSKYLVCTVGAQPRIYDRDGKDIIECIKGDMYISDLIHTRGHVAIVKDGQWNPIDNNLFATCSSDSTVRIWDINSKLKGIEQQLGQKTVIKCKNAKGLKVGCQVIRYSHDSKIMAVACEDGSLQLWSSKTSYTRPDAVVQNSTSNNAETTSICFYKDNQKLLTRSQDNSMRLWDIRSFKKPLNAWYNIPNTVSATKVALSPDERYIVTGTSIKKSDELGSLHFYDSLNYEKVGQMAISKGSVTNVIWHPILNQIFLGSTDSMIHVLCDPKMSQKGALLCLMKQERKPQPDDIDYMPDIRTPHALPMMKEPTAASRKKKLEKIRQDPIATRKPEIPLQGPGKGGKMSGPGTVTQFIMLTTNKSEDYKEDAREALLKHAEEAEKNPQYVGQAYKKTQPVTIFDYTTPDIAEQELLSSINKICSGCGLKICKCGKKKMYNAQ